MASPLKPDLSERIARLPRAPGVYLMRGRRKEVLYIGKATDLRSRVRSYFGGGDPRPFVQLLGELLDDVEIFITTSPKEALLLENTLIKKHRPRFNVQLRDDKEFLSLRINLEHPWPRIDVVRRPKADGARYFGPYHSASSIRRTLGVVHRFFQLRTCTDRVLRNRQRPCLQYQIQRCPAPCVLPVDREAYLESVHQAMLFLEGRADELVRTLELRMHQASENLAFEEAARVRDLLRAVRASLERQGAVRHDDTERDIVGVHREGSAVLVTLMRHRAGRLEGIEHIPLRDQILDTPTLLADLLSQHYLEPDNALPRELLLPEPLPDADAVEESLGSLREGAFRILVPRRGEKRELIELATTNAREAFENELSESARVDDILRSIQKRLSLRALPRTIECYDISNFQGSHIVASLVAMQDAALTPARYRTYRVRSTSGQDDFASLHEVLSRRAQRARHQGESLPDLIVIDGGKGQLTMARRALREQGFADQAVVGLAKARVLQRGADEGGHSAERVFLPDVKDPIVLPANSDERHLLERLRDEAHRVAITFHRSRRRKATLRSRLDDIPGVGPARRDALLRHFGSLRAVRAALPNELAEVEGISAALASRIHDSLQAGPIDLRSGKSSA